MMLLIRCGYIVLWHRWDRKSPWFSSCYTQGRSMGNPRLCVIQKWAKLSSLSETFHWTSPQSCINSQTWHEEDKTWRGYTHEDVSTIIMSQLWGCHNYEDVTTMRMSQLRGNHTYEVTNMRSQTHSRIVWYPPLP